MDHHRLPDHILRIEPVRIDCHPRRAIIRQQRRQIPRVLWVRFIAWIIMLARISKGILRISRAASSFVDVEPVKAFSRLQYDKLLLKPGITGIV